MVVEWGLSHSHCDSSWWPEPLLWPAYESHMVIELLNSCGLHFGLAPLLALRFRTLRGLRRLLLCFMFCGISLPLNSKSGVDDALDSTTSGYFPRCMQFYVTHGHCLMVGVIWFIPPWLDLLHCCDDAFLVREIGSSLLSCWVCGCGCGGVSKPLIEILNRNSWRNYQKNLTKEKQLLLIHHDSISLINLYNELTLSHIVNHNGSSP